MKDDELGFFPKYLPCTSRQGRAVLDRQSYVMNEDEWQWVMMNRFFPTKYLPCTSRQGRAVLDRQSYMLWTTMNDNDDESGAFQLSICPAHPGKAGPCWTDVWLEKPCFSKSLSPTPPSRAGQCWTNALLKSHRPTAPGRPGTAGSVSARWMDDGWLMIVMMDHCDGWWMIRRWMRWMTMTLIKTHRGLFWIVQFRG